MHDPHHPVRDTNEPRQPQASADPRRWEALAVISVAQFMLILDLTVVNVALPDLGADLDLSRSAFTWTVSAYVLFFGGLMLLGGRFADVFGARPVMLTGVVIFTLASLASGLAQNEILLLGGRVGQCVGAAPPPGPRRRTPRRAGRGDRHRRHRLVHLRHDQRR
jgi:MFS family permease